MNNKLIIKLLIIGDSAVGKTNILTKFCENKYNTNFVSTVGKFINLNIKELISDIKMLK